MDTVYFPCRSSTHLVLLHVIGHSGSWEKHGLRVEYDKHISSSRAHDAVLKGEVEFISGNHVSTYGHRARGDEWVYLGQTINKVYHKLVVREDSGIDSISDLRQRKVITRGSHPTLDTWLYLKQHGLDADRDEVEVVDQIKHAKNSMDPASKTDPEGWTMPTLPQVVMDRGADACFVMPPTTLWAKDMGLKVIDVEPLSMIFFTTLSTSLSFAQKNPEIVDRFLRGMIEGIHFFKTRREESIEIIRRYHTVEGQMTYLEAEATWRILAPLLEPRLMPSLAAIGNVYQEANKQDKDSLRINPMELWDLHYVRHIDDSGFVNNLYKDRG